MPLLLRHAREEESIAALTVEATTNYSTIARSFSAELMDIFRIENSLADLDSQVDKR